MLKFTLGSKSISTERPAFVMAILNATDDSFYEKSRGGLELAKKLIEQGADLLDIGGESTRPGFSEITSETEIKRVVPLIKEIRKFSDIPISVDTRKARVFEECLKAGADILNDVSALEDDEKLAKLCGEARCPVILMHRYDENAFEMKKRAEEKKDVIQIVNSYFEKRIDYALKNGIEEKNIILDPGIGFGKTFEENIQLIKNGGKLCGGKYPVMMALSRKRVTGELTGRDCPPENRLSSTLACNIIAVMNGAEILRVHDVTETLDTLNVLKSMI